MLKARENLACEMVIRSSRVTCFPLATKKHHCLERNTVNLNCITLAFRRTLDQVHLPPSQAELYSEVERLLAFLRHRPNRDKLDEQRFFLAGSMLERWKWNSQLIRDEELREFLTKAQELVGEVRAVDRQKDPEALASHDQ
ncbi:MAG: hypothetical protein OXG05_06760 [Gammaproteobacteria bacterium]|nr:hypothetical protein [Gammaproteobacteria bacterium]